jgi:hypothetical protein
MLVVSRFRYDEELTDQARADLGLCLEQFSLRPGYVSGTVGRSMDDPSWWVLTTTWANVGAYRRALSAYDIKLHVVPLLSRAVDEPSAYEVIVGERATEPNEPKPRGS